MQISGGLSLSGGFSVTALAQAIAAAADDYFKYVTMLLKADGTNTSQNNTFLDSSANNITITRNGNTTQGSAGPFSKDAGRWGVYLDGTGDYFALTNSNDFKFGTSTTAFSVEFWLYMDAKPGSDRAIMGNYKVISYPTNSNGWDIIYVNTPNAVAFRWGYPNYADTGITGTINLGAWNHIVVCRNASGVLSQFTNGTRTFTTSTNTSITNSDAANFWLGWAGSLSGTTIDPIPGYLSNVRILKGSSAYDAAQSTITVPTVPLSAITDTKLLTCQDNRYKDNSTNNFTLTATGNVSISPFAPFTNGTAYNASANGGSMYFDGTGDYLTIPNATELQLGGGNFTIECWVKAASQAGKIIFSKRNNASSHEWLLYTDGSGNIAFTWNLGTAWIISSTPLNDSWQHIALSNVGSTITMYINGVSAGSQTAALTNSTNNLAVAAGADGGSTFTGYISDLRIVKGTAVYTGAFTPPSAPLTLISGANLLLKGTNAGVLDSAMMNNIETLGNTQISTTQKKFGTASMYFDGNGDWAFSPDKPSLQFGTGDFTVEFWVYFDSTTGWLPLVANGLGAAGAPGTIYEINWSLFVYNGNLQMTKFVGGVQTDYTFAWTPSTGQWYHVAVARSGTSLRAFINGTQIGTTQTSSLNFSGATNNPGFSIGRLLTGLNGSTVQWLNGYIDDLRITKGHARYTANFTAPTETFPGA